MTQYSDPLLLYQSIDRFPINAQQYLCIQLGPIWEKVALIMGYSQTQICIFLTVTGFVQNLIICKTTSTDLMIALNKTDNDSVISNVEDKLGVSRGYFYSQASTQNAIKAIQTTETSQTDAWPIDGVTHFVVQSLAWRISNPTLQKYVKWLPRKPTEPYCRILFSDMYKVQRNLAFKALQALKEMKVGIDPASSAYAKLKTSTTDEAFLVQLNLMIQNKSTPDRGIDDLLTTDEVRRLSSFFAVTLPEMAFALNRDADSIEKEMLRQHGMKKEKEKQERKQKADVAALNTGPVDDDDY